MSEVKSFWCHEASNVLCVRASDFDNVTRLFLDAAERAVASERREKELQQRLTAADERADEAVTLLGIWQTWLGADRDSCDESGKLIWDRIDAVCGVSVPESTDHDATADLSCYFGLTYASWLTLPRVLMESMPERWKQSMARLLNEYDDAYTNQPAYGTTVRVTKDGKMIRAPEWLINYRHPDRAMIEQIRGEVHKP